MKRLNDTPTPWRVGIFQDDNGERHLAIWSDNVADGENGNPVCTLSLEADIDAVDEANAQRIVDAVNKT